MRDKPIRVAQAAPVGRQIKWRRLAAGANVLLSAVLGGRAKLVLEHPKVDEVFTTETTLALTECWSHAERKNRLQQKPPSVCL